MALEHRAGQQDAGRACRLFPAVFDKVFAGTPCAPANVGACPRVGSGGGERTAGKVSVVRNGVEKDSEGPEANVRLRVWRPAWCPVGGRAKLQGEVWLCPPPSVITVALSRGLWNSGKG